MDYRKNVIDLLRRVSELRTAERICRDRLAELDAAMDSFKVKAPKATPVEGGGTRTEERLLNIISAKEDEEKRLRYVHRELRRFDAAWRVLDERDRAVLTDWYIVGGVNCAERVASREHCDRRTAFRWRDDALLHFARILYGVVVD